MSMPLVASLKGASTRPFTGQVQSMSSRSVPAAFSGSRGAAVGGGADVGVGIAIGGGASGESAAEPDSAAFACARARSVYGTLEARGSTFDVGVFASGRDSMGGPAVVSGVVIGVATVAG